MKITPVLNSVNFPVVRQLDKIKERSNISHDLVNSQGSGIVSNFPEDVVDLRSSASDDNVRDVKRLYSANGKLVEFEYSDKDKTISAYSR